VCVFIVYPPCIGDVEKPESTLAGLRHLRHSQNLGDRSPECGAVSMRARRSTLGATHSHGTRESKPRDAVARCAAERDQFEVEWLRLDAPANALDFSRQPPCSPSYLLHRRFVGRADAAHRVIHERRRRTAATRTGWLSALNPFHATPRKSSRAKQVHAACHDRRRRANITQVTERGGIVARRLHSTVGAPTREVSPYAHVLLGPQAKQLICYETSCRGTGTLAESVTHHGRKPRAAPCVFSRRD
jgi:hypothetical protein